MVEDLKKFGVAFKKGSYLYETNIIKEASSRTKNNILGENKEKHKAYSKREVTLGQLPIVMSNKMPSPKEFGNFEYDGDIDIYLKTNYKNGKISSRRMYIHSKTDSVIKNKVLGVFELKKDKVYECWFVTVGRNPTLGRNNIWIAQRNLNNIILRSADEIIDELREKV
jgi:hypothetical protein